MPHIAQDHTWIACEDRKVSWFVFIRDVDLLDYERYMRNDQEH